MNRLIEVEDVQAIGDINGWEMDYDRMSGVIYWLKGNTRINATPNWDTKGETPFDIYNEETDQYINVASYKANEMLRTENQVKAYRERLEEIMSILDNFNPNA